MSSSLESIEFRQDEIEKCRGQFGLDLQRVPVLARKRFAFYRILLGHKHGFAIAKVKIARHVRMVIGKSMIDGRQAQTCQVIEKTLRIADAGYGVQLSARQRGRRDAN